MAHAAHAPDRRETRRCGARVGRLAALGALYAGLALTLGGCGRDAERGHGMALLRWTPVTRTTDGKPLEDLAGFRIYYGHDPAALRSVIVIDDPGRTAWVVGNLEPGRWYFAVAAYTHGGAEGARSNVQSKTIE